MKSADIKLADHPISIKNYQIYGIDKLPKLIFGYKIKNKFDEARLQIKSKYNPLHIAHFKWTDQLEPVFLYGIEIRPKLQYSDLLDSLNDGVAIANNCNAESLVKSYQNQLTQYNLTCDECYRYTCDGVYPIDTKHLNSISRKDFSHEIDSGFANMINKSDMPWFLNIANFNLYILCKSVGYTFDYSH
jgi:hypothetical protein